MRFLKQSTTVTIQMGPALDITDGVTEEVALSPTVNISKAGAAFAARNSATAISHDADGWYRVELNATDTNTLGSLMAYFQAPATHLPVWHEFEVVTANVFDTLFSTDSFDVNVANYLGSAAPALVGGRYDSSVGAMATGTVTATAIAENAITSSELADGAITSSKFASGAITATVIASGAIDADALASDAVAEIADGVLDEALTEPSATFTWAGATLRTVIGWLGAMSRNKITQTATTQTLRNDADAGNISTSALSDDGTTLTRGEFT